MDIHLYVPKNHNQRTCRTCKLTEAINRIIYKINRLIHNSYLLYQGLMVHLTRFVLYRFHNTRYELPLFCALMDRVEKRFGEQSEHAW
jgi:hypothetical protein